MLLRTTAHSCMIEPRAVEPSVQKPKKQRKRRPAQSDQVGGEASSAAVSAAQLQSSEAGGMHNALSLSLSLYVYVCVCVCIYNVYIYIYIYTYICTCKRQVVISVYNISTYTHASGTS